MNADAGKWLLHLARNTIAAAVRGRPPPPVRERPAGVDDNGACFVTLTREGQLRGCIGSLEAHRPLYSDVVENARAAAMRDPRFPPLRQAELDVTTISLSILDPAEPLPASDRAGLKANLTPGIHGLTLSAGERRATFLPAVWEQLPDADDFIDQLKRKAGLPVTWPDRQLRCERYTVTCFSE